MTVRLIGANPGLRLFDPASDDLVAFASVWRVDWSRHGTGRALVLWHAGRTRVLSSSPALGAWLAAEFTRHFPEVHALPWPDPTITETPVELEIDLTRGMRAEAGEVAVQITDPLDHRLIRVDDFDLGGEPHILSTVLIPCRTGGIWLSGTALPGSPRVTTDPRPSSTAFLADAEVWCRPDVPTDPAAP